TRSVSLDGQHDARVTADNVLTFYDNGTFWNDGPPRAVRFQIDPIVKTATLLNEMADPTVVTSPCCGSARVLDSANWLVGWGGRSTIGEYTERGDPVFRLTWDLNGTFSYRTVPVPRGTYTMAEIRDGMDAMNPRPRP